MASGGSVSIGGVSPFSSNVSSLSLSLEGENADQLIPLKEEESGCCG